MAGMFSKLYAENLTAPKNANLYGAVEEVSEAEVAMAYAEAMSAQSTMQMEVQLYAEAADVLAEKIGPIGALLYAEAEGGFFKKIINALIKVYNKAKDFVVKLLGRVKSDKSYRQDLTYIASVCQSIKNIKFTTNASLTVKKSKYGKIAGIVIGILSKESKLLTIADGKDASGTVKIDDLNKKLKDALKTFSGEGATDQSSAIGDVTAALKKLQADYPTKDQWLKDVYGACAIPQDAETGTGDADFSKTSAGTAMEQVGKLWDNSTKTLKDDTDIKDWFGKNLDAIFNTETGIKYDAIADALEKGVTELSDKIDDLKGLLKEVEAESTRVNQNAKAGQNDKNNATAGANIGMQYSTVMSNYTVVVTEGFNTAKLQLDRILVDAKGYCSKLEALRKSSGTSAVDGSK